MKYWVPILALLAAPLASAAQLDDVLSKVEGATGGEEDFMANVTWSATPDKAYYACTERMDLLTLELWLGSENIVAGAVTELCSPKTKTGAWAPENCLSTL